MNLLRRRNIGLFMLIFTIGHMMASCQNNQKEENMGKVKEGDTAPDFELPDQDGNMVKLSDFRGKQNVVLYFYPKDDTPGCTKEACTFRDSYEEFASNDTEVIGVSSDSKSSHQKFISDYNLNFVLLSDTTGKVRKLYGATDLLGLIPGRVTYVINKEGKVIKVFDSHLNPKKHVKEALQALEEVSN